MNWPDPAFAQDYWSYRLYEDLFGIPAPDDVRMIARTREGEWHVLTFDGTRHIATNLHAPEPEPSGEWSVYNALD